MNDSPLPIFIVGYMHSGTTLLRKMLGRHPQVFSIRAETMFFDQLPVAFPRQFPALADERVLEEYTRFLIKKTAFDWPPVTAAEAEENDALFQVTEAQQNEILAGVKQLPDLSYTPIFNYVFSTLAAMDGKQRWLEKTPSHIFHVERIIREVPGVRLIELVRDPRDVLASKKVRKTTDWADRYGQVVGGNMRVTKGYDPLRDSMAWRSAVQAGNQALQQHGTRFYRLRYEDLVSEPEQQIRQLCDFLELPFDPAMLHVGWSNTTVKQGTRKEQSVDASAVGKWQKQLSPETIALCQWIVGAEMKRLGYSLYPTDPLAAAKSPLLVGRSAVDLLARYYSLWRARGSGYVQSMAVNSWNRVTHLSRK